MKVHSTNYKNTLIEVAEDCPAKVAEIPPVKGDKKTVANLQFELLYNNPYQYTSDEALFKVLSIRKEFTKQELEEQREHFFSKGQPCFTASPLPKRYGWGVHNNEEGKIAIFELDSEEYKKLKNNELIVKVKAMRTKRK